MNTLKKNVALLFLIAIVLANYACSSDASVCEVKNQGTVILDNTRNDGTLYVFFNPSNNNLTRGRETISIAPNETGNIDYPAGSINVKAYVFYSTLHIGDIIEKNINLESCKKTTIVY
jgi:hypothetical protein